MNSIFGFAVIKFIAKIKMKIFACVLILAYCVDCYDQQTLETKH